MNFLGNSGHSIVKESEDRIYIEIGQNWKKFLFLFELHIPQSQYGFKKENISYFKDKKLMIL